MSIKPTKRVCMKCKKEHEDGICLFCKECYDSFKSRDLRKEEINRLVLKLIEDIENRS